jgi:hypothetical protein
VHGGRRFFEEEVAVKATEFLGAVAADHGWREVGVGFGFFGVGIEQFSEVSAAVFLWNQGKCGFLRSGFLSRTLHVLVPDFFEIDFCAEASSDHAQASAPRERICDCIVFVQVVLSKTSIYALVCEDGVCDVGLLASCAYSWRDALLYRLALALYSQDFWASRDSDCVFIAGSALRKVNQYTKRGGESMSRVGDRARVVGDKGAEFRGCGFGL